MVEDVVKYPQATERYLVAGALMQLSEATQYTDPADRRHAIENAYRYAYTLVAPILDRHETLREEIHEIHDTQPPEAWAASAWRRRCLWREVARWFEALYQNGTISADPTPETIPGSDHVNPDPSEAGHYYAETAYRILSKNALELLGQASSTPDTPHVITRWNSLYGYLRALTYPLVRRMDRHKDVIHQLEDAARRQAPRQRRATRARIVPHLVRAMHSANVLGRVEVPVEVSEETIMTQDWSDYEIQDQDSEATP